MAADRRARGGERDGRFSTDDVAWVLRQAPGEVLVLRQSSPHALTV